MRLLGRQRDKQGLPPVEISEKKGVRYLHLGGDAVQSAMRVRDPYALELEYTRAMMCFLLLRPEVARIGLIGLGGGSLAKFIHRGLPQAALEVLEINPEVVAAAQAFFFLPGNDARLRVRVGDGADYVRERQADLDVLLVDGYDARRIVDALASPEFYAACARALCPGGIAAFNLWGSDAMFETYRDRISQAFAGRVLILPAEKKGNIQVFALAPPVPDLEWAGLRERARQLESRHGLEFSRFLDRLRAWNPVDTRGFVL